MRLSLIICTYRRPAALARLLRSISGQTRPPDEVLIADGSEDVETEDVVKSLHSVQTSLRYYRVPPEERGLTRQRNYGIARTDTPIIAFLDDDTVPEPDYFEQLLACFDRHPEAAGVSGYIVGGGWRRALAASAGWSVYRLGDWERAEDLRLRARKLLRLVSDLPPGRIPPFGHGRSSLPPDGQDHQVDCVMGGASAWRRAVLDQVRFSPFFEGYGLYEDLDFSLRASRLGPLWVCTSARLAHLHDPNGRPNQFTYGRMVVRNGWYVWRLGFPEPSLADRCRWWAITLLNTGFRLLDWRTGHLLAGISDGFGRLAGVIGVLARPPRPPGREARP